MTLTLKMGLKNCGPLENLVKTWMQSISRAEMINNINLLCIVQKKPGSTVKASVVQLSDAIVLKCEMATELNCELINKITFINSLVGL